MTQEHTCCSNVLTLPQQEMPSVAPILNLGGLCDDGLKERNAAKGHSVTSQAMGRLLITLGTLALGAEQKHKKFG